MFKNVFSDEVARELGYQKQYPEWWVIPMLILGGLGITFAVIFGILFLFNLT